MSVLIKDLLPIGSVVMLEGGKKSLMIFGVKQTDTVNENTQDETSTEYDYIGVVYPEGNMGPELQFLFNHKDIKEVFFRGYEDAEREEFIERLTKFYEQEGQEGAEQQSAQDSE